MPRLFVCFMAILLAVAMPLAMGADVGVEVLPPTEVGWNELVAIDDGCETPRVAERSPRFLDPGGPAQNPVPDLAGSTAEAGLVHNGMAELGDGDSPGPA